MSQNVNNNFKNDKKIFKYDRSIDEISGQGQFYKVVKPSKQARYSVFEVYCEMLKRKSSCQKTEKTVTLKEIFISEQVN